MADANKRRTTPIDKFKLFCFSFLFFLLLLLARARALCQPGNAFRERVLQHGKQQQ